MTSFISLNVTDPPKIDYPAFSMDAFNYSLTMDSIDSLFTPIFSFLLIGLPAIAIAGAIWAIIAGKINEAVSTILKLFLLFVLFSMLILVFDYLGYEIIGISDAIKTTMQVYLGAINAIYGWITSLFGEQSEPNPYAEKGDSAWAKYYAGESMTAEEWGSNTYKTPADSKVIDDEGNITLAGDTNGDGVVDWWEQISYDYSHGQNLLDAIMSNPHQLQIGIASCFPFLISMVCLLFSLLFLSEKARTWNDEFFDMVLPEEKPQEIHLLNFNYKMGAFGILILFGAWMMFLNFVGIYNETGIINFTEIGYISIYSILIIFSIILLSFPRICLYTKSNWKNTLKGTIIGFGILFLSFQFISGSQKTLSATGQEYQNPAILQLLNTFIFIAPAESFFFHILIPAFALGWMHERSEKSLKKQSLFMIEHEITKIDGTIDAIESVKDSLKKGTYDSIKLLRKIMNLKRKRRDLEIQIKLEKDFVFQDLNTYLLFYVVMILSNIAFSISHWVLSGVDFYVFWLSGLGIIYLIAGCFITFIGWRQGWLSAILTHAFYNAVSIIMLIIFTGGLA